MTVNGKLLACERIGQNYPLGKVESGTVSLDFEWIRDFYAKMYKNLIDRCKHCLLWKNCSYCVYFIPEDKTKKRCDRFMHENKSLDYFSYYFSHLEQNPDYYKRLIDEMDQY
ncbi:MAG: hypothetical protein LUH15_05835 [Tannerellaceae bacterium]|nr:hypothetical protein [Tannerellaceae bacterium]